MGKDKKIFIVIIAIVLILCFFILVKSISVKKTTINEIDSIIGKNTYTLFYVDDLTKDEKKKLNDIKSENAIKLYKLTDSKEDVINYIKSKENIDYTDGNIYLIFDSMKYLGYIDKNKDLNEYIKKYLYGYLPVNERVYSTATIDQYNHMYNSKDKTIAVFGDDTCSYCERLEPVINDIAKNKVYNIYYFNSSRMADGEYEALLNMNITIPASCNSSGEEKKMVDGYAKPMTIVSKKGKVIGCIKGYYDYNTYVNKLKEIMEG